MLYLSTPAEAEDAPALNTADLTVDVVDNLGNTRDGLSRRCRTSKELAKLLSLLLVVRRVPRDVGRLALEKVGDEDLVTALLVRGGQDISTLEGLGEETENVVDDQDGMLGVCGAGAVWMAGVS